jgi:hypothetical protein
MPISKIDYSQTVIFKIVSKNLNIKDTYIGSTTDFTRCKARHKFLATSKAFSTIRARESQKVLYDMIINNGGWEKWDMIEIEKYPCRDSKEAHGRVRFYIESLNANLNGNRYEKFKERAPIDYLDRFGPPGSGEREGYLKSNAYERDRFEKFDPNNKTVIYLATHSLEKPLDV